MSVKEHSQLVEISTSTSNASNKYEAESNMNTHRKTAIAVGVLFIIGTVAGILSVVFTSAILDAPDYLVQVAVNASPVIIGALLVLVMGFALAMIPVMLFPILREYNEVLALGAVVFRGVLEAVIYIAIAIGWLLLITFSQQYVQAGASDASHFQTLGTSLQGALYWFEHMLALVFSLGALMIYYVFYQSKLIPRWLSLWGLIGALLYFAAPLLNMFAPQNPALSVDSGVGILMAPLALQEMVFAIWPNCERI